MARGWEFKSTTSHLYHTEFQMQWNSWQFARGASKECFLFVILWCYHSSIDWDNACNKQFVPENKIWLWNTPLVLIGNNWRLDWASHQLAVKLYKYTTSKLSVESHHMGICRTVSIRNRSTQSQYQDQEFAFRYYILYNVLIWTFNEPWDNIIPLKNAMPLASVLICPIYL